MIKLLLLDFDRTLTATHTTGALCFSNTAYDRYLSPDDSSVELQFSQNIVMNPRLFLERLLTLIDNNVCVSIITMADQRHAAGRQVQLTGDLAQRYTVLAGRSLVIRWLCCVAMRAYDEKYNDAAVVLCRLFASRRFHIVAQYDEQSKRQHAAESMRYFEKHATLSRLEPNEILYVDDTMPLLVNMQQHLPGVQTFWAPQGVTDTVLHQITSQFFTLSKSTDDGCHTQSTVDTCNNSNQRSSRTDRRN